MVFVYKNKRRSLKAMGCPQRRNLKECNNPKVDLVSKLGKKEPRYKGKTEISVLPETEVAQF